MTTNKPRLKVGRRFWTVYAAFCAVFIITAPFYGSRLINFCSPAFGLGVSASKNDTNGIHHALARGATINAANGYAKRDALMVAALHGKNDAVLLLLARGANPDATDETRRTARDLAKKGKHFDTTRLLSAR